MEFFTSVMTTVKTQWPEMLTAAILLVATLETIVNMFPTKTGAGALHRIGDLLDKARDKAGLPAVLTPEGKKLKAKEDAAKPAGEK